MYDEDPSDILERMKSKISNDLNKEEGSLIHDALTGTAEELGYSYSKLSEVLNKVFAIKALENGYSEELELKCSEIGIYRRVGTKASGSVTFKGGSGTVIPKETIVQTLTGIKYITALEAVITETTVEVSVQAVDVGKLYNIDSNMIAELENQIVGIVEVGNLKPMKGGTENESDEELFKRYKLKLDTPSTSGNIGHYKQWALEVAGVGDAVIIPTWNGGGTVKIIVLDSNKKTPSKDILDNVYNHVESSRPIGSVVTVVGAKEVPINIDVKVQLATGETIQSVKKDIEKGLNDYLSGIAFKDSLVRYTRIANILLDIPYIVDYFDLTVNLGISNIEILADSVAVLGEVVVNAN